MTETSISQPHCQSSIEPAKRKRRVQQPERMQLAAADRDVRARVHELLLSMYPPGPPLERRVDQRYPYPKLVRLTPIAADGMPLAEASITVVGNNLSERGLGFYHQTTLPYQQVIASFDAGDGRWLGLLLELSWCRFTKLGWYESGGRFVQAVSAVVPKNLGNVR